MHKGLRKTLMGDLEALLPEEIECRTLWPGEELVLPYAETSRAIKIATQHDIAVLGFEVFEVKADGLYTIDLSDPSQHIQFAGDWLAYVAAINAEDEL